MEQFEGLNWLISIFVSGGGAVAILRYLYNQHKIQIKYKDDAIAHRDELLAKIEEKLKDVELEKKELIDRVLVTIHDVSIHMKIMPTAIEKEHITTRGKSKDHANMTIRKLSDVIHDNN